MRARKIYLNKAASMSLGFVDLILPRLTLSLSVNKCILPTTKPRTSLIDSLIEIRRFSSLSTSRKG